MAAALVTHPSTGLDSTTAYHVMENLHALAQRGRTVVTTIHQPASEIFSLVDRIMLLSKGGHPLVRVLPFS